MGVLELAGVLFFVLVGAWALSWVFSVRVWMEAYALDVKVGFADLIGMRIRKVDARNVVRPLIIARKAGVDASLLDLEAHELAGGDPRVVVGAMVSAKQAGLELPFVLPAAWDLAGQDVLGLTKVYVESGVLPEF